MVPEFETILKFTDRLDTRDPRMADYGAKMVESVDHQASSYLKVLGIFDEGAPLYGKSPGDTERMLKAELLEKFSMDEAHLYSQQHGWGRIFKPHTLLESSLNAERIIRSGEIDIGLSVEPEGCAYAYFFETLGLDVLHVYAEFDGKGGIDFQLAQPLDALRGRRVLLIEDDIRTGLTLRTVLDGIKGVGAKSFSLFLGNNLPYQNLGSVPPQVIRTYLNTMEDTGLDRDRMEERFVELLGPALFRKYAVFID